MNYLQILDEHIKTLRPQYYKQLNPPLTEKQIQLLENQFNITIPDDIRKLYKWKNGQNINCSESFVNNSMFMPLQQSLNSAQEMTSMIGLDFEIENWWNAEWIPILDNGGGDSICYDAGGCFTSTKGQIIEFWHADNDRNVIAPDLNSIFQCIIDYYDSIPPEDFDSYFSIDLPIGYPIKFIVE